jgi:hypothetical protein
LDESSKHIFPVSHLHMTRIKKDLQVDCWLGSWWWLLAKILKVWYWQSNQSYHRYVISCHFICGRWLWAFLDVHF